MTGMALLVTIDITAGSRLQRIEQIEVRRLEPLDSDDPTARDNEVHRYQARRVTGSDGSRYIGEPAEFEHRYGDGARKCVELALAALAQRP